MPTIVDSLVVSLGIDASGFNSGQREMLANLRKVEAESNRTAKSMQADGAKAAEFFSSIKTEALSLLGIFLGGKGIESFIKDTTNSLVGLQMAARSIGISTQDLQAFEQAIYRMGGGVDAARGSLEALAQAKQNLITYGNDPNFMVFGSKIGSDVTRDTPWQVMQKFVDWAAKERDPQQVRLFGGMGHLDPALVTAIMQLNSRSNLNDEMRESFRLGDIASNKQIEAAGRFQESVRKFETATEGLARALIPFEWITKQLNEITETLIHPPKAATPEQIQSALTDPNGYFKGLSDAMTNWGSSGSGAGWGWRWLKSHWDAGPASVRGRFSTRTEDTSMSPEQRAFLDTLAAGEQSSAGYNSKNPTSSAHGRYQFINTTDQKISNETGLHGDDPISQDRKAWYLAQKTYARFTFGRNLEADIKAGGHEADIAMALHGEWPSLPGGTQQNTTMDQFKRRIRDNLITNSSDFGKITNQPVGTHLKKWLGLEPDPALAPHKMLKREDMMAPAPAASHTTDVDIGTLNVHTQATDAHGISMSIHQALAQEIAAQSNRGLQ